MRLEKPIGTWLLLWPTWAALWLAAGGWPDIHLIIIFALGVFFARSAGCVVNDLVDRDLDGAVIRTRARPLVTGRVSLQAALILCAILFVLAFGLVLLTNPLTIALSVGALLIACCYPFVKRISHYPQLMLGVAFSWGIPMAFTAQTGNLPSVSAWVLFAANLLWIVMYDTQYAMADRLDDLAHGIKSTAIAFGRHDLMILGILQGAVILCLSGLAWVAHLDRAFLFSLLIICGLFIYQQWLTRERKPDDCFQAFRHNNWVGLTFFAGIVADTSLF